MNKTRSKSQVIYYRKHLCFLVAITILIFSVVAYMYFVSASVVHVVIRKEINQEMVLVNSYIGELESKYIELQSTVNEEYAVQNGFIKASDKVYIDRTPTSLVLLGRNNIQ